jgi:hypothetical protein
VQLDAVEARRLRPRGGAGEEPGQHARELGDVGQGGVGDPLAIAVEQRLELARLEHLAQLRLLQEQQPLAQRCVVEPGEGGAMAVGEPQVAAEEGLRLRAPADGEEVDHL